MARDATILRAIQQLYDAALAPDGWAPALPSIIEAVGGHAGAIIGQDLRTSRVTFIGTRGLDPGAAAAFGHAFDAGLFDPMMTALLPDRARPSSSVVSDDTFARSDVYNLGVRPTGTFYAATAATKYASHRCCFMGVARKLGSEDYDAADVAALQALVPHLTAALKVRGRLGEASLRASDAYAVLDRLDIGVILVDAEARPGFVNARAAELIARCDGLTVGPGGLTAARADETRLLRRVIGMVSRLGARLSFSDTVDTVVRSATAAAGTRLRLSRPSLRPALMVTVAPLGGTGFDGGWDRAPQVAVFVAEADSPLDIDASALVELFQLTPREAAIAVRLAQGADLAEIAAALDIGLATVRSHLRQVFGKTGTNRQTDLARLILRGFSTPRPRRE